MSGTGPESRQLPGGSASGGEGHRPKLRSLLQLPLRHKVTLVTTLPALLVVLLATTTGTARAEERDSGWLVRRWQTDDGLPDNRVYAVVQAPDGFLWVATRGGLVRFDGLRFQELMPDVLHWLGITRIDRLRPAVHTF